MSQNTGYHLLEVSCELGESGPRDAEMVQRREEIRRGLSRSNTATAVALVLTVTLALAAVFYALEARQANERTRIELWNAQRERALALRSSGNVGRRHKGLEAIREAVNLGPSRGLRDIAIATLALMDIRPRASWRPLDPSVFACAFSPTLSRYALGDRNGKITLFTADGQVLLAFSREGERVSSVQFSSDESLLAARWDSGAVEVWKIADRSQVFAEVYPQQEPSTESLTFHPTSPRIAVACADGVVRVVHLGTRTVELDLSTGSRPWAVAFDPTGTRLAVGVGTRVDVFAYPTGEEVGTCETPDGVGIVAWHPFGRIVATGSPNGIVTLVDIDQGKLKVLEAHTKRVIRLAFDPLGRLLATASWDGRSRFWDADSGRPLLETQTGFALQFDTTSQRLGFFRESKGLGEWQVDLDMVYATVEVPIGTDLELRAIALSRSGRWLAGATRERLYLWDRHTGRELDSTPWARAWGTAFTTDDRALLVSSQAGISRVPLRFGAEGDPPSFEEPANLPGVPAGTYAHGSVTYGQDSYFGAEGSPHHAFVDLAPPHTVFTLPGGWDNSAPSIAGGRLASTSRWKGQGTRIWDLETQGLVRNLSDEGGVSLFSPDGRWLAVGTSAEILLYETDSWGVVRRLPRDSPSAISGLVAFSPDSRILAVTHTLRQVRLVASATGEVLATLDAPTPERITALSFSGDGSVLAAGTDNGQVQLWNLRELRKRLADLRLDWDGEEEGAAERTGGGRTAQTASVVAAPLPGAAIWLAALGAAAAFFFALYNVRHHRKLLGAYVAVEEIAARRNRDLEVAQNHLLDSQRMKALGTLAAGIAHDFNNLLSIIRMSSQLVRRQLNPTGLARENLDAIERAIGQGKNIVGSILGYTRPSADSGRTYRLNDAVSETLAMLHAQYLGGIVLTLELNEAAPVLQGDKSRLEQVLLNLIVNAHEAMNGVGKLTLSVRETTEAAGCVLMPRAAGFYLELRVRDSGPGIPADILSRIFEPFFTTKTAQGEHGCGLGLTTVYTIARQDGLGLGVESLPGEGATFRVLLPVDKPTASEQRMGAGCPSS